MVHRENEDGKLRIVAGKPPLSERATAKITMMTGGLFYGVGAISFVVILVFYFISHLWAASTESRIAFIGMLFGLFCSFQGLVFILIAKTADSRRQQTEFILEQIRISQDHGG